VKNAQGLNKQVSKTVQMQQKKQFLDEGHCLKKNKKLFLRERWGTIELRNGKHFFSLFLLNKRSFFFVNGNQSL